MSSQILNLNHFAILAKDFFDTLFNVGLDRNEHF